ncbi:MAG: hypothetical protein JXX29_17185 [Deltaproteobacteria bacterium]|nr:hypothetical protein [Deltaproteobacteria bacterium]MBN2673421.1 hypothetical protein [Deltaproteobacteria bacterium]
MNCKMCGISNADGTQFCAACGTPLQEGAVPPQNQGRIAAGSTPAKTMMFGKAPQIPEANVSSASAGVSNRTMLGAPAVKMAAVVQTGAQAVPVAMAKPVTTANPVQTPSNAPAASVKPSSTQPAPMIKMASPKATSPQPAVAPSPEDTRAKTVLGLPSANADDVQAAVAAAKQKAAEKNKTTSPPAAQPPVEEKKEPAAAPAEASKPEPKPEPKPKIQRQPTPFLEKPKATDDSGEWPDDTSPKSSNVGIIIAVSAAALIILGLVAFILVKFVLFRSPDVQPQIVPSADGEHLTVILDLPTAPPGATVQLQDKNIPVAGGKVQFLLPKKQMVLGANLVKLTVTEPGGTPEEISFPITLRHIATNDFSGLTNTPPTVGVQFQIASGFSIKVNGAACTLVNGICEYKLTIPDGASKGGKVKKLQYSIPFELADGEGNTDAGQHTLVVPITELQLDRPADGAVVDSNEITVAGSSVPGATVTINGKTLQVGETGFAATVSLPAIGTNKINIRVVAAGSAPVSRQVLVTKVEDLQPYVASWSKNLDDSFNFAKLSRNTDAYAGKKIHLTGRIININTAKGVTAFLMYVDNGCPQGGQCGVYVAFRGETDAGLQSMVDVYGKVRGTQEVDFAGGSKKALPAVDAQYVLIATAASRKKKRK